MVTYPSGYAIPPRAYRFALTDLPGVVTGNNFLSVFNPASSLVNHIFSDVVTSTYAVGNSPTATSMVLRRITGHSGGVLIAASTVDRFTTGDPDPATLVRITNPSVSGPGLALRGIPPAISAGVADGGTGTDVSPPSAGFVLAPGQGLVFGTAGGNVNQAWNLSYTWLEVSR